MGKSCMLIAFVLLLMIHSSLSLSKCKNHELEALRKFKNSFTRNPQDVLSSWVGEDCCHWPGVGCDNVTGNVIKLNLQISPLVSFELGSALLGLKLLSYLNLSFSDFNGSRIPKFIGSMTQLRYLYLSNAGFSGSIPPQIGNLTNLIHLDLSNAGYYTLNTQEHLEWASGLSKLQSLDMSGINMIQTYDTLQVLFRLPSLLALSLSGCLLHGNHLTELFITNSSTLQHLDLGHNNFEGPFPSFLKDMPSLESLSLPFNSFSGYIPIWLGRLSNLNHLDLSHNGFHGRVPASLAKLSALKFSDLCDNELNGLMPNILGHLTELEYLDISSNSIHDTISHIGNLSKLSTLEMSYNNIKLELSTNWRPPFQLQVLGANSCEMNMSFPQWIRNQTNIGELDLSYTGISGISGELPQWLWNMTTPYVVQLGGNKLTGSLPRHITCDGCNLWLLDLHSNMLSGTIPYWLKHLNTIFAVDLSENLLSGGIFEGANASPLLNGNALMLLDLSDNMLSGEIHVLNISISTSLVVLSLPGNDFIGPISSHLCDLPYLVILELAHNRLTINSHL